VKEDREGQVAKKKGGEGSDPEVPYPQKEVSSGEKERTAQKTFRQFP